MDDEIMTFEAFTETIQMTEEEKNVTSKVILVSTRVKSNDFIDLLKKQNEAWILEMLEVFRFELGCIVSLEDFRLLVGVFERSLEWVEGSSYLRKFDQTRREESKERVEKYWHEALAYREALQLITSGEEIAYVSEKVKKWRVSGFLFEKEQIVTIIDTIFRFSPELDNLPSRDLVQLVYYALDENLCHVTEYFHERVRWVKGHDEDFFYEERDEDHAARLVNAIWVLGAKMLEGDSSEDLALIRSRLFRYLYETCNSSSELIRNNAFDSLLFQQRNNLFTWDDLLKFSVADLAGAIVAKTSVAMKTSRERCFEKVGQLRVDGQAITLSPFSTTRKPVSLLEINGVELRVCSGKKINLDGDFLDALVSWKDVFTGYTLKQQKKEVRKTRPPVGAILKIHVKTVYLAKPTLAFVIIDSDEYEGEGALHVSHVTRVKLESLENILHPGDALIATVSESTDERLQFSILEEIEIFVGTRYHEGEPINALLLNVREDLLTWVSESGFLVFSKPDPSYSPEIGSFYLLEILKVQLNGYVTGKIEMPSNAFFDKHEAVARLIRQFSNNCRESDNVSPTTGKDSISNTDSIFTETHAIELTRVLQLYGVSKNSITNLNLLCFLKLVAHVLGDDKLREYYDCCIRYLTTLQVFIKDEGRVKTNFAGLESDFSKYPVLKQRGDIFKLLSVVNKTDECETSELIEYVESSDKYLARVAKLVLAGNLVASYPGVVELIRQELLSLLSIDFENKEVPEEKVEFGSENGTREFKVSAVYPAEAHWQAAVEKLVSVILRTICGFLNAAGGTLYIGVNDFGIPDGIETDLKYLRCNLDKYELFLRKEIVASFGGDVYGLIVIKFRYFGEVVVCAVSVPSYHSVVMLNGVVWQRQGNSTLLVTSGDLRLLKRRKKMQAELASMANPPLFPGDSGYDK